MKRAVVVILLVIACFLLQSTVFHAVAFGGIVPNLLIILTASFGFMRGEKTGLIIGFFCGLLMDIFFGEVIGFHALLYMYVGYTNGKFNHIFFPEDVKLPMVLIVGSDFFYKVTCYVLMFLMRTRFHVWHYFLHVMLPEIVYTIVITIFLYPAILWINRRLEHSEKRSAKKFV